MSGLVLATALLLGFLADWRPVVPIFALVLLAGAALGPKYGPFLALYAKVIKPRLAPPAELEVLEQRFRDGLIDGDTYAAQRRELIAGLEDIYAALDESP